MKLRIKQKDIITKGWMKRGPNSVEQPKVRDRGWLVHMIYPDPDPSEDMVEVMIVRVGR